MNGDFPDVATLHPGYDNYDNCGGPEHVPQNVRTPRSSFGHAVLDLSPRAHGLNQRSPRRDRLSPARMRS